MSNNFNSLKNKVLLYGLLSFTLSSLNSCSSYSLDHRLSLRHRSKISKKYKRNTFENKTVKKSDKPFSSKSSAVKNKPFKKNTYKIKKHKSSRWYNRHNKERQRLYLRVSQTTNPVQKPVLINYSTLDSLISSTVSFDNSLNKNYVSDLFQKNPVYNNNNSYTSVQIKRSNLTNLF